MTITPKPYNSLYITGLSFISALGGYLFGFDFAVISGALPFLRGQFGLSAASEGFLTGSLALGCIVGCIIAGKIAERYGRRPGLMIAALVFAASSLIIAFSQNIVFFIALRFIAGIGVGMASMLCPMYIAEISPANVRGRNVAINQLTVVIGILVTNLINYFLADLGNDAWRLMFGLGTIPGLIFLLGVFWLPESPRWLVKSGQDTQALSVLQKIGTSDFANETYSAIKASLKVTVKSTKISLWDKSTRGAVFVGITLAVFQQFCGINVVFNYTSTIFESVGSNLNQQLFETISIGIVNLLFTLLAMWLVDKLGRRPLMLIGSLGLSIIYIILAVLLQQHFPAKLVSVFVLLAISTYALSLAPVTWVLIAEIFPNKIRTRASTVAIVSLWGAYFILVFTFPMLAKALGTFAPFYFYAAICLAGYVFVKTKVRETKGQTLEQLEENLIRH
ncbi:sugar porter family MFS transporter [Mucilaginibacter sp. UYCu711]|uniref:sugar porter family MFS transporter n=1 Tax=Mucilaginibacter sp. UYCu711 TaxID=3156339 RepID=UPI003D1ABFDD